jgi:HEAT repeat protein
MKARIGTKKCRIRVEVDESQLPQHSTVSYSSDAAESSDSKSDTSVDDDIEQSISEMTKTRAWPSNIGVEDIQVVFRRFSSVLLVLLVHPVAAHVLFQLAKQRDETLLQEGVRSCKLGECVTRLDDRADIEDCVQKTCDVEREAISKMPEYRAEKAAIMAADRGDDGSPSDPPQQGGTSVDSAIAREPQSSALMASVSSSASVPSSTPDICTLHIYIKSEDRSKATTVQVKRSDLPKLKQTLAGHPLLAERLRKLYKDGQSWMLLTPKSDQIKNPAADLKQGDTVLLGLQDEPLKANINIKVRHITHHNVMTETKTFQAAGGIEDCVRKTHEAASEALQDGAGVLASPVPSQAELLARPKNSKEGVREAAVSTLGLLDAATLAQHAPAILARLDDSDWRVRKAAVSTLGKLDVATLAQHAPAILGRLEDSDWRVRRAVVSILGKLDEATLAQHAPAILARLEDSDSGVRRAVVSTLGKLDAATLAQHAPAILARLEDSDWGVRKVAILILGKLDAATLAQHAPAIVARLEDSESDVRYAAVSTLGKLDAATLAQHAPAILARLEESDWRVRMAAVKREFAGLSDDVQGTVQCGAEQAREEFAEPKAKKTKGTMYQELESSDSDEKQRAFDGLVDPRMRDARGAGGSQGGEVGGVGGGGNAANPAEGRPQQYLQSFRGIARGRLQEERKSWRKSWGKAIPVLPAEGEVESRSVRPPRLPPQPPSLDLESLSIRDLMELVARAGLDITWCIGKADLIQRYREAIAKSSSAEVHRRQHEKSRPPPKRRLLHALPLQLPPQHPPHLRRRSRRPSMKFLVRAPILTNRLVWPSMRQMTLRRRRGSTGATATEAAAALVVVTVAAEMLARLALGTRSLMISSGRSTHWSTLECEMLFV